MIIIINGSLGVGKTSTGDELTWMFDKAIHLDGDSVGNVHPFNVSDPGRIDHLYRSLALLIGFHQANGYSNFVINYVFESADSLRELIRLLQPLDWQIHTYWLTCDPQVQAGRIRRRRRDQLEWELNRALELQKIQAEASRQGFIGKNLDTTGLTAVESAEKIWIDVFEQNR